MQDKDPAPTVSVTARPSEEAGAFWHTDPHPSGHLERPGTGADAAVCWRQGHKVLSEGKSYNFGRGMAPNYFVSELSGVIGDLSDLSDLL